MAIDYSALATEINKDPKNIGYAQYALTGADTLVADLLNAITGNGASPITLASMSNADFVTVFLPYLANLSGLSVQKQSFYTLIWQTILAMPVINFTDATVTGVMAQAISDQLLTQQQAITLNQRTGSRAEVLFGAGITIQHQDIAQALNPRIFPHS